MEEKNTTRSELTTSKAVSRTEEGIRNKDRLSEGRSQGSFRSEKKE